MGMMRLTQAAAVAGLVAFSTAGLARIEPAQAQIGIVNSVINSAIQMQQQQQAIDAQRRAAERAERDRERAAAQQKQAEQQKQAAEKAAGERQAKFAKVAIVAEQLIEEVSAYLKQNPNDPKLLSYASAVASLGKTLKGNDPAAVEKQVTALNGLVQKDPRFAEFASRRAEERREQNARELVGLVKQAQAQRAFIVAFIARNPTSPAVETLLPVAKALDDALQQPSFETMKPLTESTDMALRQSGLRSAYLNALSEFSSSQPASPAATASAVPPPARPADPTGRPDALRNSLTEKNRFLLDGNVEDVVFLYNASRDAPHVLKNLKGDIVFERATASACIFQRQPDLASANLARRVLSAYALETISIDARPCAPDKLRTVDIIVVRRSALFREDTAYAFALIQQIEMGAFASLKTVKGTEISEQATQASQRLADIDAQSATGFGFLVLSNPSANVCAVVADDVAAHERIFTDNLQVIRAEINAPPQFSAMSLDAAFAGLKRGRCAAIYTDAATLKQVIDALRRDDATFQLIGLWITPDQVAAANAKANAATAEAQTRSYERQRAASEAAQIALVRAEEEAKTKEAIRTRLRAENGKKAEAASSIIANEVKTAINGTDKAAREQYPSFFMWLDEKRRDRWDVFSVNATVFEYGTIDWKGRRLEVGATQTDIRLRNQLLGEYQDYCFVFAKVFDYEFQAARDFVVMPCAKDAQIAAWKTSRDFKSLWDVP